MDENIKNLTARLGDEHRTHLRRLESRVNWLSQLMDGTPESEDMDNSSNQPGQIDTPTH